MLWLFEVLAKMNSSQKEIIEDIKFRIDLIEAVSQKIDEQIPTNFSEVLEHVVDSTQGIQDKQGQLFEDIKQVLLGIQELTQRIVAIEKATGADLNKL